MSKEQIITGILQKGDIGCPETGIRPGRVTAVGFAADTGYVKIIIAVGGGVAGVSVIAKRVSYEPALT